MDADWNKLKSFYKVAKVGSIYHASEELHISQSALSRQISSLESRLGSPLFHRHNRGVQLTGQGEVLFRSVSDIVNKVENTMNQIVDMQNKAVGTLRLSSTVSLGSAWLIPVVSKLMEAYPELQISINLDDDYHDFDFQKTDISISVFKPREPWLISSELMKVNYGIFSCKEYLNGRIIKNLAELAKLDFVSMVDNQLGFVSNTLLNKIKSDLGIECNIKLRTNNTYSAFKAVESGVGVACLPFYLAKNLEQINIGIDLPMLPVYFVYPEELRHLHRIKIVKEFIRNHVI